MSEIKEKARSFLNHGAEINRHKLIHDLLAELERVEKDERDPLREEMKSIALALGRSKTDGESDCDWHDLAGDVKQLLVDVSELGQNSCGECTDGWKYNRVEGRHACTCMTEMEPFQILQMALENSNLCLCKAHKQEWTQSEYSAENCDYCKALAKIKELECQKNACQQVVSERDQRIVELEAENAKIKKATPHVAYCGKHGYFTQHDEGSCPMCELEAENARLRKICDPQTELEALELLTNERKEAAIDCIDIMTGEYKRLGSFVAAFNTSMCAIKAHFGIKGE